MRFIFAVLLSWLVLLAPARAEDDPAPPDPRFEPMTFVFEDGVIKAIGAIQDDSDDVFRAFLISQHHLGKAWNVPVLLRSPGGALETAMKMGHMVRDHQMSTVTDDLCASACTYLFMGGINRVVAKGGMYGVHQFYNESALKDPDKPVYSANDLIRKQKLIADMQEYVLEMGVNPAIIALASKTSPVAGQDNPDGVLFLTRQQITAYEIENVPSAFADGQPIEQLAIPGVFPKASQQIVLEPLPQQQTIVLGNLNEAVSQGFVKNLFHVLEGEPADVLAYVDANYAELTNYYGKLLTKAELADVRRDYLKTWPYRRYTIDDNSMKASCDDRDNTCDVTGELDYELGLSRRGVTVRGRSSFHFVILSPGQDARVMVDEGKTLN